MKKNFLLFVALAGLCLFACQLSDSALLSGSVDNYKGEGYLLCIVNTPEGRKFDTLTVQADGKFEYVNSFEKPTTVYLYLAYLGNDAAVFEIYMANGTESKVNVTSRKNDKGRLTCTAEFSGDHKAESAYMDAYLMLQVDPEMGLEKAASFAAFKDYRTYVFEKLKPLYAWLDQTSDAEFKATRLAQLRKDEPSILFRYAWSKQMINERMDADADFVAFAESFDLNDMDNLQMTEMILRWKEVCNPSPGDENHLIQRMKRMKQLVSNQEVVNALSYTLMEGELLLGNSSDIQAIFEHYKQTTTDSVAIAKFTPMYNRLIKLVKGAPAMDFEMQDAKGNTVRFLDIIGKGKVTYIDFWATWCGPCLAENPHLEKLAERYKGNPHLEILSISMDNDPKKWVEKIDADKPAWRQYIIPDNFNSDFAKAYNLEAIPRFMAFDKKGRIISVSAPRPSAKDIDAFIQSCIQ